jgi:3-phosphoshikimate 1-carboxyvinyltransferase
MKGGALEIEQTISSQFVSALMLIAPFLPEGIRIKRIGKLNSESYVTLTADLMKTMNFKIEVEGNELYIPPSKTNIRAIKIEADWSAAAYWMAFVVLVLDAKVTLIGLNENSVQGDRRMLDIMNQFSLGYYWEDEDLVLYHDQNKLNPLKVDYDLSDIPDQAQTLAFLCACLGIEANLRGLETLSFKETDRIDALYKELTKLGLTVSVGKGAISINGKIKVHEVYIECYNDHRMAMAASLLGSRIDVIIDDPEVVAKSYPNFWNDLQSLTIGSLSEE